MKTLLAVDDSATMRKVLEITFSGEDFRVITADSPQSALARLAESPSLFLVDSALGPEDGYAFAKELRRRSPNAPIVLLTSRYAPYDPARGRDAGVDDWADKPFDTQQLIDKVKRALAARESGTHPVSGAPPSAGRQGVPSTVSKPLPPPATAASPLTQAAMRSTHETKLSVGTAAPVPRSTLAFDGGDIVTTAKATPHVASAVESAMVGKLGELGLSKEQTDAVLALSRDVVERVAWEVVPQLAEAIIKEEIARLMRE